MYDDDLNNIESRLVYTPERQRMQQENSLVFHNKFQELIEKLMETRNQSLVQTHPTGQDPRIPFSCWQFMFIISI